MGRRKTEGGSREGASERSAGRPKLLRAAVLAVVLLIGLRASPAAADYFEARAYMRQGKYRTALDKVREIPTPPPELRLMEAECLQHLDRHDEALGVLEKLVAEFPRLEAGRQARRLQISLLERKNDFAGLIRVLREALDQGREADSPLVKELAMAHLKAGHPDEAVAVLEAHPTSRNLKTLFRVLEERDSLESYLAEREKQFRGDPEAARILGTIHLEARHMEPALEYLAKAPVTEETLLARVAAAGSLGRKREVLELHETLARRFPKKGVYLEKLGELYLEAGERDRALATWRSLLESQGESQVSYAWVARVLSEHGFCREVLPLLEGARRKLADGLAFYEELARCHAVLGEFAEAAREYLRAAPLSFDSVREPLVELARRSDAAYEATRQALMEAVESAPTLPEYYYLGVDVLRIRGYGEEVRSLIERMCRAFRTLPRELLEHARELAESSYTLEALQVLEHLEQTADPPELWEAELDKARLERRAGERQAALETLDRLELSNPEAGYRISAGSLRGSILLDDLNRHEEARRVFEGLLQSYPASESANRWRLSVAQSALGMLETTSARSVLEAVQRGAAPVERLEATYLIGYLDQLQGRFEEAMEQLTAVTIEDTGSAVANDALEAILFLTTHPVEPSDAGLLTRYFLLRHCLDLDQLDRYEELAATVSPETIPPVLAAEFLMLQARAQSARGDWPAARRSLELILAQHAGSPLVPEARLALADLLEKKLSEPAAAAEMLKEFLMSNPDSLRLEEIRERLERLSRPES